MSIDKNDIHERATTPATRRKLTIAEKMAIAEELRDLQRALEATREANKRRIATAGHPKSK